MNENIYVHLLRKSDLLNNSIPKNWDDPEQLVNIPTSRIFSNPLGKSDSQPVFLAGIYNNRVIGCEHFIQGELNIRRQKVPVLWESGLIVSPEYRNTGIGLKIILRAQKLYHTITGCGVSQMVYPIYKKLKWVEFEMPRWVLLLRSRTIVEKYIGKSILSRVLSKTADIGLCMQRQYNALRCRKECRQFIVKSKETATPELDDALETHRPEISFHRSIAWINWLLQNNPQKYTQDNQELYYIHDESGTLVAYFLIKIRFYPVASKRGFPNVFMGSLQDWFIFEHDKLSFRQLILLAIKTLDREDIDAIEVCLPETENIHDLSGLGFHRIGSLQLLIKTSKETPFPLSSLDEKHRWLIRPAEGDNFFA